MLNNETGVFIIQKERGITALKLSSYTYDLAKKMNALSAYFSNQNKNVLSFQKLSKELYTFFIQSIEQYSKQRLIIIPPIGYEKFPFHSLTKNNKPLIEMIEVTYLPSLSFAEHEKQFPQFINILLAFGYTTDSRWGLEFELRDIRSFFKNAQVFVNQSATLQKLDDSFGEILHLSSQFQKKPEGEYFLTLSNGSVSGSTAVPISHFTSLHSFPLIILSDVQSTTNNITQAHSLMWLYNNSASVITNEYPINSKLSRMFEENFYSTLSTTLQPYVAYRKTVLKLNKQSNSGNGISGAAYFFYGF